MKLAARDHRGTLGVSSVWRALIRIVALYLPVFAALQCSVAQAAPDLNSIPRWGSGCQDPCNGYAAYGMANNHMRLARIDMNYDTWLNDHAHYDAELQNLSNAGVYALPLLFNRPAFNNPNNYFVPPGTPGGPSLNQWEQFAYDVARRYGFNGYVSRNVNTWEVWNEPNDGHFWNGDESSPVYNRVHEFRDLLAYAHVGIRNADPNARIISGGLAMGQWNGYDYDHSPLLYLANLLGGDKYGEDPNIKWMVEGIALHPYSPAAGTSSQPGYDNVYQKVRQGRIDLIDAYTDGSNLQLWNTESGWNSTAPNPGCSSVPVVSSTADVRYKFDAVKTNLEDPNNGSWKLGPFLNWDLSDVAGSCSAGLFNNGTLKDAGVWFRDVASLDGSGAAGLPPGNQSLPAIRRYTSSGCIPGPSC